MAVSSYTSRTEYWEVPRPLGLERVVLGRAGLPWPAGATSIGGGITASAAGAEHTAPSAPFTAVNVGGGDEVLAQGVCDSE